MPTSAILLAAVFGLGASRVLAQIEPGASSSTQTIPEKDRSHPQHMPKAETPRDNNVTTGRGISEQLDKNKGLIKPPKGIDPGIKKPAPVPNPDNMPVVPPPGPPGPVSK